MALKTTNRSVRLHFYFLFIFIFFKSPNIFLWVNEGDASAQVSVWLLNDRSLIPPWSLNPNVSLISLLLDCRAVVLCAGIFLHTADAASASGPFAPRGQALYFTSHTRVHHTVGSCVCVCACIHRHTACIERQRERWVCVALHCFYCLPLLKLKVWSWDIHGGSLGLFASHSPPSSDSWSNNLFKKTSIESSPPGEIHISSSFARMETQGAENNLS